MAVHRKMAITEVNCNGVYLIRIHNDETILCDWSWIKTGFAWRMSQL